jgi:hypothetical protein
MPKTEIVTMRVGAALCTAKANRGESLAIDTIGI